MSDVLGDLLPIAAGVAVSPIPIIAVILMLLSPRAGRTSAGLAAGWVVGIVLATVAAVLIAGSTQSTDTDPSTASSWFRLILGLLLVIFGVRQWRARPGPGETAQLPGWLRAIDQVTPAKAAGLGAALAAANPKNLLLCLSAGVSIGAAGLSGGENTIAVIVFTAVASCTIVLPVMVYALAADRIRGPLTILKGWLEAHNAVVTGALLLIIGLTQLGKGLGELL